MGAWFGPAIWRYWGLNDGGETGTGRREARRQAVAVGGCLRGGDAVWQGLRRGAVADDRDECGGGHAGERGRDQREVGGAVAHVGVVLHDPLHPGVSHASVAVPAAASLCEEFLWHCGSPLLPPDLPGGVDSRCAVAAGDPDPAPAADVPGAEDGAPCARGGRHHAGLGRESREDHGVLLHDAGFRGDCGDDHLPGGDRQEPRAVQQHPLEHLLGDRDDDDPGDTATWRRPP